MLATDYPLLDVFWTMLWFFLFFLWIWLLVMIFADIFRSHDLSGGAKALWVVFVIFLPFLGVLLYLIFRGGKMQERNVRQAQQDDAAFAQLRAGRGGDLEHRGRAHPAGRSPGPGRPHGRRVSAAEGRHPRLELIRLDEVRRADRTR